MRLQKAKSWGEGGVYLSISLASYKYMSKKSVITGIGNKCPKCSKDMMRHEHPKNWAPTEKQTFYFRYWNVCKPCMFMQHYEVARVNKHQS